MSDSTCILIAMVPQPFAGSSKEGLSPPPLAATAAAAIGAGFAALAQYVSFVPPAGQVSLAAAAIGCLLLGLAVGCCCGLGWGLLIGSAAPKATALVGRAVARAAAGTRLTHWRFEGDTWLPVSLALPAKRPSWLRLNHCVTGADMAASGSAWGVHGTTEPSS